MRRSLFRVPIGIVAASLLAVACSDEPDVTSRPTEVSPAGTTTGTTTTTTTGTTTGTTEPVNSSTTLPDDAVTPDGFERVRATVTEADGAVCDVCLWLADDGDRRSRGLMFVTDLGPADGMAFVYPSPHSGNFWMKNTVLPLSIAFFGPDGGYLDSFDMAPCTAEPCDLYPTADDFVVAIETVQGGLADLGIGPGSVLALSDLPCDE